MPSTRDPVTVVQPGPGHLAADTVSATALTFEPSGGGGAALEAHLTDPIDAHDASAISAVAAGGGVFDVQKGLEAKAYWVLDADPAHLDADFSGPSALQDAVSALVNPALAANTRKPALFLRASATAYTWAQPASPPGLVSVLDRVRIVGSSHESGVVLIEAGAISFGRGTVVEGVSINATGLVSMSGSSATLRRVRIFATGTFLNQVADNVLESVQINAAVITLGSGGTNLACFGGTLLNGTTSITQLGNRGSFAGGKWTSPSIAISGGYNTFLSVEFNTDPSNTGTNNIFLSNDALATTEGPNSVYLTTGSSVLNNLTVTGTFTSTGGGGGGSTTVVDNLNANNNVVVGADGGGNLTVNGNVLVSGNISNGPLGGLPVTVDDDLTVNGKLTVNGASTLAALTASGSTTINNHVLIGNTGFGNLTAKNNLTVGTDPAVHVTQLNSSLSVGGQATFSKGVDITDNLTVGYDGSGNLTVHGTGTIDNTLTAGADLYVNGNTVLGNDGAGDCTIHGNLTVDTSITSNSSLTVKGNATIGTSGTGDLSIKGTVTSSNGPLDINSDIDFHNRTLSNATISSFTVSNNLTFNQSVDIVYGTRPRRYQQVALWQGVVVEGSANYYAPTDTWSGGAPGRVRFDMLMPRDVQYMGISAIWTAPSAGNRNVAEIWNQYHSSWAAPVGVTGELGNTAPTYFLVGSMTQGGWSDTFMTHDESGRFQAGRQNTFNVDNNEDVYSIEWVTTATLCHLHALRYWYEDPGARNG